MHHQSSVPHKLVASRNIRIQEQVSVFSALPYGSASGTGVKPRCRIANNGRGWPADSHQHKSLPLRIKVPVYSKIVCHRAQRDGTWHLAVPPGRHATSQVLVVPGTWNCTWPGAWDLAKWHLVRHLAPGTWHLAMMRSSCHGTPAWALASSRNAGSARQWQQQSHCAHAAARVSTCVLHALRMHHTCTGTLACGSSDTQHSTKRRMPGVAPGVADHSRKRPWRLGRPMVKNRLI